MIYDPLPAEYRPCARDQADVAYCVLSKGTVRLFFAETSKPIWGSGATATSLEETG